MSEATSGVRIGRYVLERRIANGGMGEVFIALQTGPGGFERPVALKLLLSHLHHEPSVVQMFLDEARLASRMSHRNIVQILDVGVADGRHFIAMELVHGLNLSRLLQRVQEEGRLLSADVLGLMAASVFRALAHAHALRGKDGAPLQLVHRDVSPHNLIASTDGEVKLTDFGIAKARDTLTHTHPGLVKGKLEYLPPEQFENAPVDARADVYSAGITLFHLATGASPFRRSNDAATMLAIREEPLPSLAKLRPDLSPGFVAVLERAAARHPEQRFPTAAEACEALPAFDERSAARELSALLTRFVEQDRAAPTPHPLTAELSAPAAFAQPTAMTETRAEGAADRVKRRLGGLGPRGRRWATGLLGAVALGLVAWGALSTGASDGVEDEEEAASPGHLEPGAVATPAEAEGGRGSAPVAVAESNGGTEVGPGPVVRAAAVEPPSPPAPALAPRARTSESSPSPRPTSRSRTEEQRRPRVAGSAAASGFLTVDALPWAKVFAGQKLLGETPIHRVPMSEGSLELEFRNPDTGKRERRRVRIQAGRETRVRVDLR